MIMANLVCYLFQASAYLKQGKYREADILYKQIFTRAHESKLDSADGMSFSFFFFPIPFAEV